MLFMRLLAVTVFMAGAAHELQAQKLTEAQQIAVALKAAPDELRVAAAVMGYDTAGKLVTLRPGTNDLICLADDPAIEAFEVACHHKSVEPYIARGRALRAQGVTGAEINNVRFKEMQEGKLALPDKGASNYILTGTYDLATGEIRNSYLRWVVYMPYATTATTGLSTKGGESLPWLMGAGTPGAHIMIVPPRKAGAG